MVVRESDIDDFADCVGGGRTEVEVSCEQDVAFFMVYMVEEGVNYVFGGRSGR